MDCMTELTPYLAALEPQYQELLKLLAPQDVAGQTKLRIGPAHDGGYVMLDPGRDGIAYSFGISDYSPWDREMAERGFKVYQYDGTVAKGPDEHPNLIFTKANISGEAQPPAGEKNLSQILRENGHESVDDIILQIDIEGGEWEFFEHITPEQIGRFSQIIVEFHDLLNIDKLTYYTAVIEKINRTHCPFHIHYNNHGSNIPFADFIACDPIEVSFVRRAGHSFSPSQETFPTALDSSNNPEITDIAIGNFFHMARNGFTNFVSDKSHILDYSALRIVYLQDAQKNQLTCIKNLQRHIAVLNEQMTAEKNTLAQQLVLLQKKNQEQEQTIYRLRHPLRRLMSHIGKKSRTGL